MRNRNDPKPLTFAFPPSYDWHSAHVFVPRVSEGPELDALAQTLLRNDNAFQHLLRQCKKRWIVALTLGAHTATIAIYDPVDVDDPLRKPLSSNLNPAMTSVFETDRYSEMKRLTPERQELVAGARPFLHAERLLKPNEVALLQTLEQANNRQQFDTPLKVDPQGDLEFIRQAETAAGRPRLTQQEIAAMGQELFGDLPVKSSP